MIVRIAGILRMVFRLSPMITAIAERRSRIISPTERITARIVIGMTS